MYPFAAQDYRELLHVFARLVTHMVVFAAQDYGVVGAVFDTCCRTKLTRFFDPPFLT